MSLGAAAVGAAFSPINPFQVGIAQQLAQLPLLSGWLFRIAFLAAALGIWVWGTLAYAARTRTTPTTAPDPTAATLDGRRGAVLALVLVSFAALVVGVLRFGWGFNEMAALFFAMGVIAGLVGGLGVGGTAEALVAGFRSMAYAALLIGFARAIFVTLEEGRIVDTIVHGLFTPVAQLPLALAALGMMVVHGLVHVPVPSPSGHAVLTLPILVPLSDLLGLSRQVTVLAYQYGGGLCELFTPTNGALMAILAFVAVEALLHLRLAFRWEEFAGFLQSSQAIQNVVFLGLAVLFLANVETRIKRRRALAALHELRSIAHIVDMHQLTKDPDQFLVQGTMTRFELARYLDYRSELLSLTSKAAALYVQDSQDPVLLDAVNDVETLTTGLSRKIWQKIIILDTLEPSRRLT